MGEGSDHLQLIKFWPYCAPGRGSAAGRNFWLRPTTASAQCLRLSERFFTLALFYTGCGGITDHLSQRHLLPTCSPSARNTVDESSASAPSDFRNNFQFLPLCLCLHVAALHDSCTLHTNIVYICRRKNHSRLKHRYTTRLTTENV